MFDQRTHIISAFQLLPGDCFVEIQDLAGDHGPCGELGFIHARSGRLLACSQDGTSRPANGKARMGDNLINQ
jgi:hypothetical protein